MQVTCQLQLIYAKYGTIIIAYETLDAKLRNLIMLSNYCDPFG